MYNVQCTCFLHPVWVYLDLTLPMFELQLHCVWYFLGTGWVWRQCKKSLFAGPVWLRTKNVWKRLVCIMMNGVPRPKNLRACGPSCLGIGTSLGTPFITIPPRVFHTLSCYYYSYVCMYVTLRLPPMVFETGRSGELWLKINLLNWQN